MKLNKNMLNSLYPPVFKPLTDDEIREANFRNIALGYTKDVVQLPEIITLPEPKMLADQTIQQAPSDSALMKEFISLKDQLNNIAKSLTQPSAQDIGLAVAEAMKEANKVKAEDLAKEIAISDIANE